MKNLKSSLASMVIVFVATIAFAVSANAAAMSARTIDKNVMACLERFYKQVPGAKAAAEKAKGVLVMPGVVKAGLVVGGEYGEGALRINGRHSGYYNLVSASFGLQIGGQKKDIIILFMDDQAMEKFKNTQGWEAGVDANITMATIGAGNRVDFTKIHDSIVAFVFGAKGLIADVSFKGAKFTKIEPK